MVHPGVAENQKEREVPHALALLGRLDERIHDRRSRDLLRRFAAMGRAVHLRHGVVSSGPRFTSQARKLHRGPAGVPAAEARLARGAIAREDPLRAALTAGRPAW
jgi:hypothetical protein